MKACLLSLALVTSIAGFSTSPVRAQTVQEWSARAQVWNSDRQTNDREGLFDTEAWGRATLPVGADVDLHGEAWLATNPLGKGDPGGDVREGYVQVRHGRLTLKAGRQLIVWGRADRINPTDAFAARDYRRLTEDEDENRLGQATVSLAAKVAGGTLTAYWSPEFRASRPPVDYNAGGIPVLSIRPGGSNGLALRYEKFASGVDVAITLAQTPDHTPWLRLGQQGAGRILRLEHPRLRMIGADLAATIGSFGVRFEGSYYDYDRQALSALSDRTPKFAAVLGVDRSFAGQWMVLAQGIVRTSAKRRGMTSPIPQIASRNEVLHGAWKDPILGATLTIRKTLGDDKGRIELTGAWLSGGGSFLQARGSHVITGSVRLQLLAERFSGNAQSFFGRLRANNLAMIGLRAGF